MDSSLPDLLKLDNQICFSVYAASRAIIRAYRPILEPYDLTYPQYLVLLILWENGEQPVGEIGKRLYLDSGTLTPLLKRMEQTGYVKRIRSEEDERIVMVKLAPKAEELKLKAIAIPNNLLNETHLDLGQVSKTKVMVDQLLHKLMECSAVNKCADD